MIGDRRKPKYPESFDSRLFTLVSISFVNSLNLPFLEYVYS